MSVHQEQKKKKSKSITFIALRIHLYLVLKLVFDTFFQFLYISAGGAQVAKLYLFIIMGLCEDCFKFT